MALSWRTQLEFPYLPNYEAASKHEKSIAPIRGDKDKLKPLGRRDQKQHAIWRTANDDIYLTRGYLNPNDPASVERRWGHVMAIYKPDGTILLGAPPYGQKAAECEIFNRLFGCEFRSMHNGLWVETRDRGYIKLRSLIEDNRFRPAEGNRGLVCDGIPVQATHAINRKGMAEVRRRYAPLRAYCAAISKLRREETITIEERKRVIGTNEHGGLLYMRLPGQWGWARDGQFERLVACMQSDEPEDQYYAWMCFTLGDRDIDKVFDNALLAAHPDECLIEKEHTDGKIRKDVYGWVFK